MKNMLNKRMGRRLRAVAVAGAAAAVIALPTGAASAASGIASYQGCSIDWSNSSASGVVRADSNERSNCARVKADVRYRNTSGVTSTTNTSWVVGSDASVTRFGEGVNSIHRADNNTTGSSGIIERSF